MRVLASLLFLGWFVGCSGDSSVVMSVWNDASALSLGGAVASGGSAGYGGSGGHGGAIGAGGATFLASGGSSGTVTVTGGARDLATAQCVATSGGSCPAPASYLQCMKGSCGGNLTKCYSNDGVSKATGGVCISYATCMLACPCNSDRSNCETTCLNNYGLTNADCSTCLVNLLACASMYGCVLPTTCSS